MEHPSRRLLVVALPEDTSTDGLQILVRALELTLRASLDRSTDVLTRLEILDAPGDALEDALNRPELHPTADPSGSFSVRPKGGKPEDWAGLVRQLADGTWEAEVRVDGRHDGMTSEVLPCSPPNRRAAARLVMAAWNGGRP
jgi:hypothetical protein